MITEERLKELIVNKADIYVVESLKITKLKLNENCCIDEKGKMLAYVPNEDDGELVWGGAWYIHFSKICETAEEADWDREFKRIVRVEYLDLPNWKEFIKRYTYEDDRFEVEESFSFVGVDGIEYYLCSPVRRKIYVQDINGYKEYAYEFSKEGYIKACELAKRLFLGKEE